MNPLLPKTIRRLLVAGALLAGLLAWAPAASAHAGVVGTTPVADEVLDVAPGQVEVQFDSGLLDVGAALVVRSAAGDDVTAGPVELGRTSIAVPVDAGVGPGTYTVAFRVVSADGHEVSSSFVYVVAGDEASASATPSEASQVPPSTAAGPSTPTPTQSSPSVSAPATATPVPADATAVPGTESTGAEQPADGGSGWSPLLLGAVAVLVVAGVGLLVAALLPRRREG